MKAVAHLMATAFLAASSANAATADTAQEKIDETGLERQAILLGPGKHDLYDATRGTARTFQVTRTARTGGHRFEVVEIGGSSNGGGFFDQSDEIYRSAGKAHAPMQLALSALGAAEGWAKTSVFDLFADTVRVNKFGEWLGAYLQEQGIPIDAPKRASDIVALQDAHRGVRFGTALNRWSMRVIFWDGEAQFTLSSDEMMYRYEAGSARDLDLQTVPENPDSAIAHGFYAFPGGEASSSYRGFSRLMQAWTMPTMQPDWNCETVTRGVRCMVTMLESTSPVEEAPAQE